MRQGHFVAAVAVLLGLTVAVPALAVQTKVMLRVRAADAKFIGSSVGGLNVVVTDAATGKLLDAGHISGGTGDTTALMKTPQTRGRSPPSADTGGFIATVDIDEPRRLKFSVTGPVGNPDATQQLTVTSWVVPDRDILGDGLVLRLPGLAVKADEPKAGSGRWQLAAEVTLMCGCPITADGLWSAKSYEVHALLRRGGETVSEAPLAFTGQRDRFDGAMPVPPVGRYRLIVWAYDRDTGNTGASERIVEVK